VQPEDLMYLHKTLLAASLALLAGGASAQSNLGDLLDKGGQKMMKADYMAMAPFRIKYVWPQGGGEGDLLYNGDGTLAGSEYHYSSRSESPAVGTWTVDDNGKWCMKKSMATWNSKTDMCWYMFKAGDQYFGSASDGDRTARVARFKSLAANSQ
jgi:hypothetical protein